MSYRPTYVKGEFKAICDICGVEYKASELQKRWDGFMVCSYDWEPRQPQDFVRGVADFQAPPFTRPETQDTFTDDFCTPEGSSDVPGYAQAGCSIPGKPFPSWYVPVPPSTFNQ